MEKVSIIVPVYNAEKFLRECIDSIIHQTYTNIEIVLINDGSKDESFSICKEYLNDSRVSVYNNENHGVSYTRNFGITHATGHYIMFVDSDDIIDLSMVEKLVNGISDADLAICGMKKIYTNQGHIINTSELFCENSFDVIEDFLRNIKKYYEANLIQGPCGKLFLHSIIVEHGIQFPKDMSYGEDTVFVYDYIMFAKKICCIQDTLYHYMVRSSQSLSTRFRDDKLGIHLFLINKLKNILDRYEIELGDDYLEQIAFASYTSIVSNCVRNNQDGKAIVRMIHNMNSNEEIIEVCDKYRGGRKKYKFLSLLIKHDLALLEYCIWKIMSRK